MRYKHFVVLIMVSILLFISCGKDPISSNDEKYPTVSINNPPNNSEWDEGIMITIKAIVNDDEGIKKVEFYIDGTLEFTDETADYGYEWNTSGRDGTHVLLAKAYNTNNNSSESSLITVKINNVAPTASFTVSPSSGNTSTVFQVDASGSSDKEDPTTALQVRWDWESDGAWDTDYALAKTAEHTYGTEGTMRILMEVKDTNGQVDTTSMQVSVNDGSGDPGTVTDIDGNVYHTVKISNQWWMVENLRVTHYRNGAVIPFEPRILNWQGATRGLYCYYDNDVNNISEYGLLYNFHAADNANQIAPEGWHVASHDDWKELEMYLGMSEEQANLTLWRGTDEGGKLKEADTTHWNNPNTGATNESGFTALAGGIRDAGSAAYGWIGQGAYFWTSTGLTASNNINASVRILHYTKSQVSHVGLSRLYGLSVRCVMD